MADLAQQFRENTINEPVSETILRDLRLVRTLSPYDRLFGVSVSLTFSYPRQRADRLYPSVRKCCYAVGRSTTTHGRNPVNQSCKQQQSLLHR